MGSARAHGEALVAGGGDKRREMAEMALAAMAEDKCSAGEIITAAAGQVAGQEVINAVHEELADNDFFCLVAEEVGPPEFGLSSPVGLHVSTVETAPTTMDDIQNSEFREVWIAAMKAELGGHREAGTFSSGKVPDGVNVISAKWVFCWKTDAEGIITKAKARLVARGFGQRFAVDYFETFAATPSMSSIKLVMAVAVQEEWPLYHLDVTQAFVQAKVDTDVFMKLPEGCSEMTGSIVKLEKCIYGTKQASRQWSRLLCRTLLEDVGMVQCQADPCVFRKKSAGRVSLILVVHVDDILISGDEKDVKEVERILNSKFPVNNLGEVNWYMGCAVRRDWDRGTISVSQTTFADTLLKRFDVQGFSDVPASVSAQLGPTTGADTRVKRPYRNAVGGLMWLATVTRPDIANAVRTLARQSHDPCERHWDGVTKVLRYINKTKDLGLTFQKGHDRLSVFCDADYAKKETDRRSVSGVAVMYGGAVVSATSRTQHCITLSTTEAEYVAMAEGAKEGLYVQSVLTFLRPKTLSGRVEDQGIVLYEDNEGAKALAENPLSSERSKHIDVRYHFIRDLVGKETIRIVHVDSGWQHADVLTKPLSVNLFERHRRFLMNLGSDM